MSQFITLIDLFLNEFDGKMFHWIIHFFFKRSRIFKVIIFFIPIAIIFLITAIRILFGIDDDFYEKLTVEDGPIENATAIAYFISFIFSLAIAKFFKERSIFLAIFLILALGFLFIALEEISWGQRIFNFKAPDWFPQNYQGEMNIHNREVLQRSALVVFFILSVLGSFTWFVLPKIYNSIFKKAGNNYKTFLRYAVPSKYLMSYFFPILPFTVLPILKLKIVFDGLISLNLLGWDDFEALELLLSIGILLFLLHSYIKLKVNL